MYNEFLNELKEKIDASWVRENEPMKLHTTFRVGGPADVLVTPDTETLPEVIALCKKHHLPYYVIGNGSNLLVGDKGIRGVVIAMTNRTGEITCDGEIITAGAGATLGQIAVLAAGNGLTGFEFAAGIPGTLGGALMMNAGAYGGEMKDVVEAVSFMDSMGEQHVVSGEEMEFTYRKSALADTDCIITGATIKLNYGDRNNILAKMNELAAKRREKQPLEFPSAGSTFKRPVGYYAGALIEEAQLKGVSVGGAQVSEKHAGFIINKNKATTKDIVELITLVRNTVYEKNGVYLETEVKYWD